MKYAEVVMPLRKRRDQLTEEDFRKMKELVVWSEDRLVPENFIDEVKLAIQEADARELFALGERAAFPAQQAAEW
jgi:hypothetical protein